MINRAAPLDFVNGVADLSSMKYTGTIGPHVFTASAGALANSSNSVTFTAGPLSKFAVTLTTPQANAVPFASAAITAQDVAGNTVTTFDASNDNVTIAVDNGAVAPNSVTS